jgi:hypothetical protein
MTNYYISYEEVKNFLNASYDEVNLKYTIFNELTLSKSSFEFNVDFADMYLRSYAGDIPQDDKNYNIAKLCALNYAGFRILVVASGGLLQGVSSFRLGDLLESREASLRIAVENSINSYREEFLRLLNQLGTIASKISASSD